MEVKHPDVEVQLSGQDGTAFSIIRLARGTIQREVGPEAAEAYAREVMESSSYDALIQHAMRTVTVQ